MLVTNQCHRICEDENAHQYNSTVDVKKMCHRNVMKNAHQKNVTVRDQKRAPTTATMNAMKCASEYKKELF